MYVDFNLKYFIEILKTINFRELDQSKISVKNKLAFRTKRVEISKLTTCLIGQGELLELHTIICRAGLRLS